MAKILVIDDTALARESVSKLLEYEGFETLRARNGKEGWAMMYNETPDLILLDLMMPEMDGFGVVAALQKEPQWRDIPVIVITARDLEAADRERLNSGVRSVLVKDRFRPAELVERIRRLMRKSAADIGADAAP